jgi:hypothetical protein
MKEFIEQQKKSRNWKVLSHNQIKQFKKIIGNLNKLCFDILLDNPNRTLKEIKKIRRTFEGIIYNWEHQDKKEKTNETLSKTKN